MATQILNPSPKTRFMQSGDNISRHKAMVDDSVFNRSADFALLHYQTQLAQQVTNGNEAAAAGFKAAGALEFLQVLKTLAESAPASAPMPRVELNHNA